MKRLSERVEGIQPSMTMHLSQKAQKLKAAGEDIISLVAGVPGFNTPEGASEAGIKAIQNHFTEYTQVEGIPELREAIARRYQRDYSLDLSLAQIMVTTGAKHSLHNIFNATINPGDEVILHAPFWVSYPDMIRLCGGVPIIIEGQMENGLKLTKEELEAHITPRTKMIILNNPNNPSGVLYNNADLNKIAEVFREYPNILFVSDDIYDMIYWADQPAQMLNVAPDLSDRIIIANGISKSYAMSGWRIGYIIAPEDITKAMIKFQSQSLSNPCSVSQKAAVPALNMSYTSLLPHVRTYQKRVERVYKWLSELEGVSCLKTEGTFYLFPNIEGVMKQKGISSDIEFCERLLDQAKVALTPGSAFGLNGYVRITCSFDDHILEEGLKRFKKFVS